jgi:hypothetical protein
MTDVLMALAVLAVGCIPALIQHRIERRRALADRRLSLVEAEANALDLAIERRRLARDSRARELLAWNRPPEERREVQRAANDLAGQLLGALARQPEPRGRERP